MLCRVFSNDIWFDVTKVASVEVPLYVTFHFINAYEETDDDGRVVAVVADCCEHNADPYILDKLRLHNLRTLSGHNTLPDARYSHSFSSYTCHLIFRGSYLVRLINYFETYWPTSRVGRFTIPLDGSQFGKLEAALDPEEHGRGMDMCSFNPAFLGKKYRYTYACGARRPCNFPNTVTKVTHITDTSSQIPTDCSCSDLDVDDVLICNTLQIDLETKTAKNWHEEGAIPSEPYFVPRPGATEEDDGEDP